MFVFQQSSLRNANKEISTAIFFKNIGRFINVLLTHSELLEKKVTVLGIKGTLTYIFNACTADVLDLNRLRLYVNDERYQWRLAS